MHASFPPKLFFCWFLLPTVLLCNWLCLNNPYFLLLQPVGSNTDLSQASSNGEHFLSVGQTGRGIEYDPSCSFCVKSNCPLFCLFFGCCSSWLVLSLAEKVGQVTDSLDAAPAAFVGCCSQWLLLSLVATQSLRELARFLLENAGTGA